MSTSILGGVSAELSALVDQARPIVVCVGTGKATPRTGLIIGNGEVLTVAKAAETGESVPVHLGEKEYWATVSGFDASSGIALLSHANLTGPETSVPALPAVGSLSVTVACPIPAGHEARLGMIRCVGGTTRLAGGRRIERYFQTDSTRFRGFAGAVVFGPGGEVLGMTMPVHRREEGFVLPIDELLEIAKQLREGESLGTGYFGIQATAVDLPDAHDGHSAGLLVTGVEPDSPAERAGLRVGNFVVKVGENATPDLESLYDSLVGLREGEELPVSVVRAAGGLDVITVKVTLRK